MTQAWALGASGNHNASIRQLQDGVVSYLNTDSKMMLPYFYALLAEIELASNNAESALSSISLAQQTMQETETQFYAAEIHRLKALCMATSGADKNAVEKHLKEAISVSELQKNQLLLRRVLDTCQQLGIPDLYNKSQSIR